MSEGASGKTCNICFGLYPATCAACNPAGNATFRQSEENKRKAASAASASGPSAADTRSGAVLIRVADVHPEPVEWLWPGRIPIGKLTLLVGDPGLGKSFVTLDCAARITSGRSFVDALDAPNPIGNVVLLSAEDDVGDTIRPRLDAAGADVSRIVVIQAVRRTGASPAAHFSLETDLEHLERAVVETGGVRLIVIDPISAYVGMRIDSHKNTDVRGLLAPLGTLADRCRAAVVCVSHLSKAAGGKAVYRAMGSLAFAAAARAVWLVAKDRDDDKRRLLLPVKMNIGPEIGGLAYRIDGASGVPIIAWEPGVVTISADEALADRIDDDDSSERDDAKAWLAEYLAGGTAPADDVLKAARQEGIAKRTLLRAKKELGVVSRREGFGPGSRCFWTLPAHRVPETP